MIMVASHKNGIENFWCSPNSTPVRPVIRNVAGVSGLTGKPTVIWPISDACAMVIGAIPNSLLTSAIIGITPK